MNRSKLMLKWREESAVTNKHRELEAGDHATPMLIHDDGVHRVYALGKQQVGYYVTGPTEVRPAMIHERNHWTACDPALDELVKALNVMYPTLPGKSSQARGEIMRAVVQLTAKGYGLGDTVLWHGLIAKPEAPERAKRNLRAEVEKSLEAPCDSV